MVWILESEEVNEVAFARFDEAWNVLQKKKSEIVFFDYEEEDEENQTYHMKANLPVARGRFLLFTLFLSSRKWEIFSH